MRRPCWLARSTATSAPFFIWAPMSALIPVMGAKPPMRISPTSWAPLSRHARTAASNATISSARPIGVVCRRMRVSSCLSADGVGAAPSAHDRGQRRRASRRAQLCAPPSGGLLVDAPGRRIDDDAIVVVRGSEAHELVAHVAQHTPGLALEGIAPAARPRHLVAEDVAALDRHRQLRLKQPVLGRRVEKILRRPARPAAVEPEWTERAPVGANLEHAFRLYEPVIATQTHPTAEAAGTAGILNELEREDLERVLELADLHRIGRHVGEHRRVAVDAVGPGPAAPSRAEEVDEDERRVVGVVAAQ